MRRKVNLVGQNTLTVSLPNKWAAKYAVKKGDELELNEKGKHIIISHDHEALLGEKTIDLRSTRLFTARMLIIPYIHGYDVLRLFFKDKEMLNNIKNASRLLLGFEMIEEGKNSCVIKNVATAIESEFLAMNSRMFYVVASMGREMRDALEKQDFDEMKNIRGQEDVINKLNLFCRRMLNTKGSQDRRETTTAYSISCYIEAAGDAYRDIADFAIGRKIRASKELLNFFSMILDEYDCFLKLYRKFETELLADFKSCENKIFERYIGLNLKREEMIIAGFLIRAHFSIRHATEELD